MRRMLLAVAAGAIGMMVLARVATLLTLAPVGFPEPWEHSGPPAAVAPGDASGAATPDPAIAAVVTGLPAPPVAPPTGAAPPTTRAATNTTALPAPVPARSAAAAPSGGGTAGSSSGSGSRSGSGGSASSPAAGNTSGSDTAGAAGRSAPSGSGSSGSSTAPVAKVCLQPVLGGCLRVG